MIIYSLYSTLKKEEILGHQHKPVFGIWKENIKNLFVTVRRHRSDLGISADLRHHKASFRDSFATPATLSCRRPTPKENQEKL